MASCWRGRYWLSNGSGAGWRVRLSNRRSTAAATVGHRPVVAAPVAQAEGAGEPQLLGACHDSGPANASGRPAWPRPGSRAAASAASARHQLGLDGRQREQGLAQREGEARADLEDGEMGLDQRAQRRLGLVVGGVRLEDEAGRLLDRRRQRPGALGHEVDDLGAAELHAGLHHHGQDPRPGLGQARPRRRRHGGPRSSRARSSVRVTSRLLDRLVGAAGDRHLGADHVDRPAASGLGRAGQPRGPARRSAPAARARGRRRRPCWRRDGSWRSPPRRSCAPASRPSPCAASAGSWRQGLGPRWSPPRISRSAGRPRAAARPVTKRRKSAACMPV